MRFLVVAERTIRYRLVIDADDSDDAKWLVWHDPTLLDKAEQETSAAAPRIRIVRPAE